MVDRIWIKRERERGGEKERERESETRKFIKNYKGQEIMESYNRLHLDWKLGRAMITIALKGGGI